MSESTTTPQPSSLFFDFSGLRLEFRGLTPELACYAATDWASFRSPDAAAPDLVVDARVSPTIAPAAVFDPKSMTAEVDADRARFTMGGGSGAISRSGSMCVSLSQAQVEWQFYTLANLLCAGLAWTLPERGGLVLHAAAAVLDERAFVLVGPEGSGKSTWAAHAKEGGARILSDDIVVVAGVDTHPEVLSMPFRDDHPVGVGPGRWPLAGILFPEHALRPALKPVPSLMAGARLAANLPFVADGLERYARPLAIVEQLTERVPVLILEFARDIAFLDTLRAFSPR